MQGGDRQELARLRADLAFSRVQLSLIKALRYETKRQAAEPRTRSQARRAFAERLDEEIAYNNQDLLRQLAPLNVRSADLLDPRELREAALFAWDQRVIRNILNDIGEPGERVWAIEASARRFAAELNAARQQALGIDRYVWRSRDDPFVRSLHTHHDDKIFFWSEPPEDGHPGEAYNCRCVAEPYIEIDAEWQPAPDEEIDRRALSARLSGAGDGVLEFLSDLVPSLDDLRALRDAVRSVGQASLAAGELAGLLVKQQTVGLTAAEEARLGALMADAAELRDNVTGALADAPSLARQLSQYLAAVEARPEAMRDAHAKGETTLADVEAAYRERARVRTLVALYGLSVVGTAGVSAGVTARALVKRILREQRELSDDTSKGLLDRAMEAAKDLSPFRDWAQIPNPGIVWGRGIKEQGRPWEQYLAERGEHGLWIEKQARNFKTFDFWDPVTRTATSAKTLDTAAKSYTSDPRRIYSQLKAYIDRAHRFTQDRRRAFALYERQIASKRVQLAVPNGATEDQMKQIERAREYANSLKIELEVTIVK